jgi:hypothetical protein
MSRREGWCLLELVVHCHSQPRAADRFTDKETKAMTRLPRSATLIVAFSLLTSAATAYAECAWVV